VSWSPIDFVVDFFKPRRPTPARVARVIAWFVGLVLLIEFTPPNPEPFVFLAFPTFFWLAIATWNYVELYAYGETS
jgi:hypothetical protein